MAKVSLTKLTMLKNTLTKFALYEIKEMTEEYKQKVKELKKERKDYDTSNIR